MRRRLDRDARIERQDALRVRYQRIDVEFGDLRMRDDQFAEADQDRSNRVDIRRRLATITL